MPKVVKLRRRRARIWTQSIAFPTWLILWGHRIGRRVSRTQEGAVQLGVGVLQAGSSLKGPQHAQDMLCRDLPGWETQTPARAWAMP